MFFVLFLQLTLAMASCPSLPTSVPKNETWIGTDVNKTTLFIGQGGYRVFTQFNNSGELCPFTIDFMRKNSTVTASITADVITVTIDQSNSSLNETLKLQLEYTNSSNTVYLSKTMVTYSQNVLPGQNGTQNIVLDSEKIELYGVKFNSSYSCKAPAEVPFKSDYSAGLKILPAAWEAFSSFGKRTHLQNYQYCPFNSITTKPQYGEWNLTVPDGNSSKIICGKLNMASELKVQYITTLNETVDTYFTIPNNTAIFHTMDTKCNNEHVNVTFSVYQPESLHAVNFTMVFNAKNNMSMWNLDASMLSYYNSKNPMFPNLNSTSGVTQLSASNLSVINATYGFGYMCEVDHWVNLDDYSWLRLFNVSFQPFNVTNGMFGGMEVCLFDDGTSDIVTYMVWGMYGALFGGLLLVVIITCRKQYVQKKDEENKNAEGLQNLNYDSMK